MYFTLHVCDVVLLTCMYVQVKNDLEAKVLCLTAIGLIKLQCSQLDEVKVGYPTMYNKVHWCYYWVICYAAFICFTSGCSTIDIQF